MEAIARYEIGMPKAIIKADFNIRAINTVQGNIIISRQNYEQPFPKECADLVYPDIKGIWSADTSYVDMVFGDQRAF